MAVHVLVDAGFLIAFLSREDAHHPWAAAVAPRLPLPWRTCESALSEAFHLLGPAGGRSLATLLRRGAVVVDFDLAAEQDRVLRLLDKYGDLPMGLADACLVRMSETAPDPLVVTTDGDFRLYRRHGRQAIPLAMPGIPPSGPHGRPPGPRE